MSKWQEYQFKNLGKTYGGLTNKNKDDFGFGKPYIPYLNIFENTFIDPKFLDYVNIKHSENQNKTKFGDLFFTTSSETPDEVGMTSVLYKNFEELYLNSFCFGFRLHSFDILLPRFAGFLFRSSFIRKNISVLAQGSTRYNLSKNIFFDKLFLNLPPLHYQRKIARILTTIDNVIEKTESAIAKYKLIKQGMMHDLFTRGIDSKTGKLRPTKDKAPHLYKKTALGWIPKEWEVERLEDVANIIMGQSPNSNSYNEKGIGIEFLQGCSEFTEKHPKPKYFCSKPQKIAPVNSFLISVRAPVGDLNIADRDYVIGRGLSSINAIKIDKDFLYFFLLNYKRQLKIREQGSTFTAINSNDLHTFLIKKPFDNEQEIISNKLISLDNKIETEQKQLSKLQKLKQGLMQDLLTGKKEVEPDEEDYNE